jgi:hypothetical protein
MTETRGFLFSLVVSSRATSWSASASAGKPAVAFTCTKARSTCSWAAVARAHIISEELSAAHDTHDTRLKA